MRIIIFSALLFLGMSAAAQEGKTYTVNSIQDNKEELIRDAFRYPAFKPGIVMFNDGVPTKGLLNYHRLYDQILFISPKGDTLALANPGTFKYVAIDTDTFYVQDKGYLERRTHYAGINLARKGIIGLVGYERQGAYGTYSSTSASEARTYYRPERGSYVKLQANENAVYKAKSLYFLSDAYNNFFPATKKNFHNLFNKQEKMLKEYLDAHKVNFNREEDLLKLMTHLQGQ